MPRQIYSGPCRRGSRRPSPHSKVFHACCAKVAPMLTLCSGARSLRRSRSRPSQRPAVRVRCREPPGRASPAARRRPRRSARRGSARAAQRRRDAALMRFPRDRRAQEGARGFVAPSPPPPLRCAPPEVQASAQVGDRPDAGCAHCVSEPTARPLTPARRLGKLDVRRVLRIGAEGDRVFSGVGQHVKLV